MEHWNHDTIEHVEEIKVCEKYFYPDDETVELMSDGYLIAGDVNICDECWAMLNNSYYADHEGMISDADPGL